jgi:hypothetical protein
MLTGALIGAMKRQPESNGYLSYNSANSITYGTQLTFLSKPFHARHRRERIAGASRRLGCYQSRLPYGAAYRANVEKVDDEVAGAYL